MPKLRRQSGKEVIKILQEFGFEIYCQRRCHIRLQRLSETGENQLLLVALHGIKTLKLGTFKSIFREAIKFIPVENLHSYFYTD
jgi:predicted RNA binding protein YcfA (HicA-like mRNA interferase family)